MQAITEILIIAATAKELAPLENNPPRAGEGIRFAVTGAGKVSTALATSEHIQEKRPDWIIQTGCAGAYDFGGLGVAEVAIATLEIFADEGALIPGGFLSMKDLELPQASKRDERIFNKVPVDFPSEDTLERIRAAVGGTTRIEAGPFCTVSTVSGIDAIADWRHDLVTDLLADWKHEMVEGTGGRSLVETMEGAAAALVAWKHGIRFSEIRGVSNMTGDRDRKSWNIPRACEVAAEVVDAWIEQEGTGT